MSPVNLYSIVIVNKSLTVDLRDGLFKLWGIKPKPDELSSLETLVGCFSSMDSFDPKRVALNLGCCYFGFVIPQISKEFDCLWIGNKTIVNVELKSQPIDIKKIQKQLVRNRYYLRHLNKTVSSFTFVSSNAACYSLDDDDNLISVDFAELAKAIYLVHEDNLFENDIEILFPPERYLVSPFNATEAFLEGHYFLTDHQQEIKTDVLDFINSANSGCFYAIYGGPGTGKSLLIYDIAKTLMDEGKKVTIGHAGSLNNGHACMNSNGWDIRSTKNIVDVKMSSDGKGLGYDLHDLADVYFIDEAQRCYNLKQIADEIAKQGKKCVFSLDPIQIMRDDEGKFDNSTKVTALVGGNMKKLTSNIRTNPVILDFTNALFDCRKTIRNEEQGHVEITYCHTLVEVRIIQEVLKEQGY